jgi:hypothetical protein
MRLVVGSTSHRGELRSRDPRKTLRLLIGMTVAGMVVLILLVALSSFPATNLIPN